MALPDEEAQSDQARELTRIEAEAFFYTVYEHLGTTSGTTVTPRGTDAW